MVGAGAADVVGAGGRVVVVVGTGEQLGTPTARLCPATVICAKVLPTREQVTRNATYPELSVTPVAEPVSESPTLRVTVSPAEPP